MADEFSTGEHDFSREATRNVDPHGVADIVASESWQQLAPNFPSENALLPRDLQTEQVQALIEAVAKPELTRATSWERANVAFEEKAVAGVGRLEKVGAGEGKVCYVITTPAGAQMAVLLRGYAQDLGNVVPEDQKMIKIKETPERAMWEYSDLRTYALFPVTPTLAVQFQEFGGRDVTQEFPHDAAPGDVRFSQGRAAAYVHARGRSFTVDRQELSHPRHALFNQGTNRPPAIIDVPVIEHTSHRAG